MKPNDSSIPLPNVEDCPDFLLPAHFTFDPDNKEEQAEIQRRAELHKRRCSRCGGERKVGDVIGTAKIVYGGTRPVHSIPDDREPEEIEREHLEQEIIKAAKLWRRHPIGANKFELERAIDRLNTLLLGDLLLPPCVACGGTMKVIDNDGTWQCENCGVKANRGSIV